MCVLSSFQAELLRNRETKTKKDKKLFFFSFRRTEQRAAEVDSATAIQIDRSQMHFQVNLHVLGATYCLQTV